MPVKWLHPNPDGHSWTVQTYIEEVAPSIEPGAPKHAKQTWFIVNLQPDGVCLNCRRRPGLRDPVGGYYSCEECRAKCEAALCDLLKQRNPPAGKGAADGSAREGAA